MFKQIGLIMIIMAFYIGGIFFSNKISKRLKELEKILLFFKYFQIEITSSFLILKEIVIKLSEQDDLKDFEFLNCLKENSEKNISFEQGWNNAVEYYKKNKILKKDDLNLLMSVSAVLGKTDKYTQLKILEDKIKKIEFILENSSAEVRKKCKLYKNLGLLSGIAVAVFLM